jgi:N-acetylmuramoyl-L-alanine amidase
VTGIEAYSLSLVALCIWREARSEPDEGMIAVGCTIRERVNSPKWWGNSYISCVTKKWQFSSMSDPSDPQLAAYPREDDPTFLRCLEIAEYVMSGEYVHPMPRSTHYYAEYIPAPGWAARAEYIGKIGRHLFFHLDS